MGIFFHDNDPHFIVTISLLIVLFVSFLLCFVCCTVAIRWSEAEYRRYNEMEWHIDQLPSLSAPLRGCNALGCGCGPSCGAFVLLRCIDQLAVRPSLRKSLSVMKRAEESGLVDPTLCDQAARDDMVKRVNDYYHDIYYSRTLNLTSKVMNYAAASRCLSNHAGLLKLGMTPSVAKETVRDPVFIVSLPRTGTTILHRTMSHDTERWKSFDLCDMMCPLPHPVARNDRERRAKLAEQAEAEFGAINTLFPGWMECLETMHGFRFGEADEDLGWYDTGLGHMYFDVLMVMYYEQRAKPGGMSPLESQDCARYRYAWLDMIMKIYQNADSEYAKAARDEAKDQAKQRLRHSCLRRARMK